ncbi:hypothetical protein H6P81_018197 [Aristolochia fimbriata]|uniref:Uncharacterized protein n=1 Tax=Aristolochia fimbriata TaxID=158543 RepID=A0AAV7E0R3_ARIFI|nr:hypothetical protein H6P81_018197 [Aristolochia fimbriata]
MAVEVEKLIMLSNPGVNAVKTARKIKVQESLRDDKVKKKKLDRKKICLRVSKRDEVAARSGTNQTRLNWGLEKSS